MRVSSKLVRNKSFLAILAAACWLIPAMSAKGQVAYQFTTLDDPLDVGGQGTVLSGISGNTIIGNYKDPTTTTIHGFTYTNGTFATLDDPSVGTGAPTGFSGTYPTGISGGIIVGHYLDLDNMFHGFINNGSTYTPLNDPLGVSGNSAIGIDGNLIVGAYTDSSGNEYGYLYNGSTFATLDDPTANVVATTPTGISGSTIVGHYTQGEFPNTTVNGFAYNGSTYTTINDPSGIGTLINGISANNIVGNYRDSNDINHGFLYNGSVFTTLDDPLGVNGTIATGIDGTTIVGYYLDSDFVRHGFIATSIPEPASTALLCLGSLMLLRRRCD